MLVAQKIRIFPTQEQEKVLWDLSEKCRLIYNIIFDIILPLDFDFICNEFGNPLLDFDLMMEGLEEMIEQMKEYKEKKEKKKEIKFTIID